MSRREYTGLYANATAYWRTVERRYREQGSPRLYDNESELVFADWAEDNFKEVRRITDKDIKDGGSRADFLVRRNAEAQEVVVEVKRLEDSKQEQERMKWDKERTGVTLVRGRAGGKELRKKVRRARKQFRSEVTGRRPCILVLMDDTEFHRGYIEDHEVMGVMYGSHVQHVSGESHFGGGRTTTPEDNTGLSAIVTLAITPTPGQLFEVRVYHNIYAAVRVTPEDFYPKEGAHFVPWGPGQPGKLAATTANGLGQAIATARARIKANEQLKHENALQPATKWMFYVDKISLACRRHLLHIESCSYRQSGEMAIQVGLYATFKEATERATSDQPKWDVVKCEHCSRTRE